MQNPQEQIMKPRAMPDLSTIEVARLDPASLRLVTRAVEIEARRMRAQAMRDLLRQLGQFIRRAVSFRPAPRPAISLHRHAH
jgi:hypothetical protein